MDNATQVGSLIVRARTGYGLYPLENAHVTVTLEDREDSKVVADVYTDNSGNTPIIKVAVEGNNRKGEYYPTGQDFTVEVAKDGYGDSLRLKTLSGSGNLPNRAYGTSAG